MLFISSKITSRLQFYSAVRVPHVEDGSRMEVKIEWDGQYSGQSITVNPFHDVGAMRGCCRMGNLSVLQLCTCICYYSLLLDVRTVCFVEVGFKDPKKCPRKCSADRMLVVITIAVNISSIAPNCTLDRYSKGLR